MYKKILAAVNESTNSEIAARYAVTLAKSCQSKLAILFVAEDKTARDALRRAESALERLFLLAKAQGVDVETITRNGDPFEEIIETVSGQKADLVFAAARREDVQRRLFIRTLPRELILKAPASVCMVRVVHMGKTSPRNIIAALGGRAPGVREKVYFTVKLAQGFGSRVTLMHLTRPMEGFFNLRPRPTPPGRERLAPDDMMEYIDALEHHGVPYEKRLAHGVLAQALTSEAAIKRSDLVILGASGRSALDTMLKGSPVEDILREAPCNLMVLRPRP